MYLYTWIYTWIHVIYEFIIHVNYEFIWFFHLWIQMFHEFIYEFRVYQGSRCKSGHLIPTYPGICKSTHLIPSCPGLSQSTFSIQGYPGLSWLAQGVFSRCWHRSCKQALWTLPGPVWKLLGPVNWGKSDWTRQSLCHNSISQFQSDTAMLSLPLTRRGLLFALNLCLLNERGRGKKNEGVWVTVLVLSNSSAQNLNGEHRDQQSWSESSSISLRR